MAQSIWYRILSALMLLAIILPVFPTEALSRAEAAEAELGIEPPTVVAARDFTVPRPVEAIGELPNTLSGPLARGESPQSPAAALPHGASSGWWAAAQEDIRRSEYAITWQDKTYLPDVPAAYQSPNRAHNLRTYFTPAGIRVIPRLEVVPSWQWGLILLGYGYEGRILPVIGPEVSVSGSRIEYRRGNLTEWYVNDERGLEQGFTIAAPPPGTYVGAALHIDLALTGNLSPVLNADARSVEFATAAGARTLRYGDLRAYDAAGRELLAHLSPTSSHLSIAVDTTDAYYPITVDPIIFDLPTIPVWTAEGDQAGASFGDAVGTAGDVNGDGYDDIIVGAPLYDNGQADMGKVFVYYGSSQGPSITADWTAEGNQQDGGIQFGFSVGTAGNVGNPEGYGDCDDIIIGAPKYDNLQIPLTDSGAAFVWYGCSPNGGLGLSGTPDNAGWTVECGWNDPPYGNESDCASAYFGWSVGTAGNVGSDGEGDDGYDDVIVGAPGYWYNSRGGAFVWYGSESGLLLEGGGPADAYWWVRGDQNDMRVGHSVSTAGNVSGDGRGAWDDVIIGAPGNLQNESASVYYGELTGGWAGFPLPPIGRRLYPPQQQDGSFGHAVGTTGDVNGDGFDDIIVGAYLYDNGQGNEGMVFVYHGSSDALDPTADWTAEGNQSSAWLGYAVGTAGDVDDDNCADIIVGASGYDTGGAAFIWYGCLGAGGPGATPDWWVYGDQATAAFGSAVGTAGDVDGDGYDDVIVGAPNYDNGQTGEGQAYVFYHIPTLLDDMCNTDSPTCALNGACAAAQYWVGGAINTANGNHSYQIQDLSVPTVGGALAFKRTYASQHADDWSPLGYGWTHNYSMTVDPPDDANDPLCVVATADGSRLRFFVEFSGPSATFTPYPGVQGTLAYDPIEYAYYLTDTAQTVYIFNAPGRLIGIRDPQGRETTLTYNNSRLSQVTGPGPENDEPYLTFDYVEGTNQLEEVCDHTGRCVTFTYQNDDLHTATDVRGYDWEYTYTGAHLLDEVWDPNDHLVERTDYDGAGRAISQTTGAAVAPTLQITYTVGGTRVITDARSVTQTVHYDGRNTWGGTKDAAGHAITRTYDGKFNLNYVADANGNPTELAWSECGCRPEVITDALGYETRMLYDAHNNLISTTDALNHTTLYTYSNGTVPPDVPPDLLIETRDALGYHIYYTYSVADNPLDIPAGLLTATLAPGNQRTRYYYDVYGQVTATVAFSGGVPFVTTTYSYDELGRQISTTQAAGTVEARATVTFYDGGGYVTRTVENCTAGSYEACRTVAYNATHPDENIVTGYAYDGVGNRVRVTNTLGIVTAYGYDDANRLITVTENYEDGSYSEDAPDEDLITTYEYDAAGNQTFVIDPAGIATRTFYDTLNRPVTVTANFIDWGQYDPRYPDQNVSTSYGYDAAGNQVTVTNPLGMVTLTGYDELNRPVVITQNYTTTTPNPDPSTYNLLTRYGYDAAGNQTRVTDPRGVATCYEYDPLNRVTAVIENSVDLHGLPGPLNVTTEYGYDAAGNRIWVRNPHDVLTRYDYDDLGRLIEVVENSVVAPLGTGDENITTRYRYDLLGNRTRVIDALGTVTRYEYDGLDRTITTTANYGSGIHSADRNVVTITRYDGLGRRIVVINALDIETRYYYDDLGRTVEVKENVVDLPAEQEDENVRTIMVYDQRGNRIALIDPEGYTTTYGYDALSRLVTVTDPLEHETVYAYDAAGNRTSVTDANENVTHYTYDQLGRAIAVEDALDQTTHYAYDAGSNRIAITDAAGLATRYDYDALARLITVTENYVYLGSANADTNVRTAYGYNLLGNLTTITNARDYVTTYTYDALSRLVTETDALDHSWAYVYDALGRRTVLTDASGITTTYEYDALSRLLDVTYGGTITATYAYNALGQRIAMTDTTGVTRYGFDALGRVTELTHTVDTTVAYTLAYRYDARSLRTGVVYPDSSVISYTYDAAARLTAVLEGTTPYAAYEYDPAGRLTESFFDNDVGAVYEYDAANRLTEITYQRATEFGPELRARYAYTYDEVGNRTRAVETVLASGNEAQAALPGEERLAWSTPAGPVLPRRAYSGAGWGGLLFAPLPQPLQPPIVRERGSYRAAFDAAGLRFYPRHPLFGDAEHEVAYRLTVVRRGNDVVLQPGHEEPVLGGEDLVQYQRGDTFAEEYALTASGVEQRFRFLAPITGTGDLVIEGNLTGDLRPVLEPNTGEITFQIAGTDEVVASYGRAVVQDATGRRLLAPLELNGAHLRIVVPGEWLAQAVYPVVVDPLIGTNVAVSAQEIAANQERAAAAYGGNGASLAAWSSYPLVENGEIYAQIVLSTGALLSPTVTVYTGPGQQQYPDVAADTSAPEYLVVWQSNENGNWDIYGQRVAATGSAAGKRLLLYVEIGDQQYPAVTHDGVNDRYLIVWQSYANSRYSISSRVLQADGATLSPTVAITSSASPLAYPDVAFNAVTGEYLVVWQGRSGGVGTPNWEVAGRRVGANGQVVGARLDVATGMGDQVVPAVAAAASGGYLVVYQDAAGSGNVRGQRVEGNGSMPVGPFDIATGTTIQGNPDVTYGAELQEYLVVWEHQTTMLPVSYDIAARRVTEAGVAVGEESIVYAGGQDQRCPVALYNAAAAAYLAVWQDGRLGNDWDIYARLVGVDGSLPGSDFLVSSTPVSLAQDQVAVAYGAQQGLHLAVWRDYRNSNYDIYGQLLAPGGALVGPAISITVAAAPAGTPAVAYNATADEFLVVWAQSDGEEWDLYARRVSGAGVVQGNALVVSSAAGDQTAPAVAFNAAAGSAGEWLVVWEDTRNGNYDLYGQRVDPGGLVGSAIVVWVSAPASHQRYPDVAAVASAGITPGYLVVAEHPVQGASDVYGVYLSLAGTPGTAFAIAEGAAAQTAPAVAYSAAEAHYLVVWQEQGDTSPYDIWGRFVPQSTGQQLPDAFGIATAGAAEETPDVVWGAVVEEWYVAWQEKASALAPYDVRGAVLDAEGALLEETEALATAAQSQVGVALAYDSARSRYLAVWADSRNGTTAPDVYAQLARGYSLVVEYAYDGLYRLTGAAYSDGATYGYAYDRVGNRTRYTNTLAPVAVTSYAYDAADRLTAVTRAGVPTAYTWSDRGELLSDGVQSYEWDAAGRLIGVTGPEDLVVSYSYNGANSRVGTTVNGVATTYIVDPHSPVDSVSQVLEETTGNDTTRNLYGLDLFAQQQGETTTYLAYDALSVRLHLDEGGALAATYRYGPYGEVVGTGPEGYGYTGEQWDHYIKITFLRARYYQPETGRFVSRDPKSGTRWRPATLNRFVYAVGSPNNLVDPTGLQTQLSGGLQLMSGGRYGRGRLRVDVDNESVHLHGQWDVYVPQLGVSMTWKNLDSSQKWCWWSNSDAGSEWWTYATLERDAELPWRSRGEAAIATVGNWGVSHNTPVGCNFGPSAPNSLYGGIDVNLQGIASFAASASMSYPDADDPASLGYRDLVQFYPYNYGRNVNIEATDLYSTEGTQTGVTAKLATGAVGVMSLAAGLAEASQGSPNMRRLHISLQVRRGTTWAMISAQRADQRAIIRSFHLIQGQWGTNIKPAYLYWDEAKGWAEEAIVYPPTTFGKPLWYYRPTYQNSSRSTCTTAEPYTCSFDWLTLP